MRLGAFAYRLRNNRSADESPEVSKPPGNVIKQKDGLLYNCVWKSLSLSRIIAFFLQPTILDYVGFHTVSFPFLPFSQISFVISCFFFHSCSLLPSAHKASVFFLRFFRKSYNFCNSFLTGDRFCDVVLSNRKFYLLQFV